MPHAAADDGTKLYFEETGRGAPVVFVHEFAGDMRSWEPQMRHFGQRYRGAFLVQVDCGRWPVRDARALVQSITGIK